VKPALLAVAAAYLLGSVSFGYLIVRFLRGEDVRRSGSGNAGATNVYRLAGTPAGVAVLLLDVGKGAAAVALARALGEPEAVVGAAALAVVLGHAFPVYFGFRGGKGVATSIGAFTALAPLAALAAVLAFFAVVVWQRRVSLGSMVGAVLFPVLVWWLGPEDRGFYGLAGGGWVVASALALSAAVLVLHRSNLRRLLAGTEPRLGETPETEESRGGESIEEGRV
jgi:glycerol-3-phosphate acyltransferase PlsY